ncbi:hypothetical protein RyT2_14040 [Pseudolactococcus yaeyamensis]
MDIKIRNLDDDIVRHIDEVAKSKGQTRESYLRMLLRRHTDTPFLMERSYNLEEVGQLLSVAIDRNREVMVALIKEMEKLDG